MSLIIDGHNLIGILPDIQLDQPDDERRLLERLRAYRAWSGGRSLIVFFDSSPSRALERTTYPQTTDLSSPGIQVRFAEPGQTADDAIVEYLRGPRPARAVRGGDQRSGVELAGARCRRQRALRQRVCGSAAAHPAASFGIGGAGSRPARSGLRRSVRGVHRIGESSGALPRGEAGRPGDLDRAPVRG